MSSDPTADYTEDNLRTITQAAHIRQNPGMYIGNMDAAGLHRLLDDLIVRPLDDALTTPDGTIGVALHLDDSCSVTDNVSGINTDFERQSGRSKLELEFMRPGFGRYTMGGPVVNALSKWCEVETHHGGWHHRVGFARGELNCPHEQLGPSDGRTGTTIRFKPDPEIFGDTTFDFGRILRRLCLLAFLNAGVRFTFTDERTGKTDQFQFPDGLAAYVAYLNTGLTTIHEPISFRGAEDAVQVEVAIQLNADLERIEMGYMNDEFTRDGGTHLTGLRRALTTTLKHFGEELGLFPATLNLKGEDFRDGVVAVVSVRHPNPEWEGATRSSVSNSELIGIVTRVVRRGIEDYLSGHPTAGNRLCEHIAKCARIRNAAEEAVHRVQAGHRSS